jgi:hypothetical protein
VSVHKQLTSVYAEVFVVKHTRTNAIHSTQVTNPTPPRLLPLELAGARLCPRRLQPNLCSSETLRRRTHIVPPPTTLPLPNSTHHFSLLFYTYLIRATLHLLGICSLFTRYQQFQCTESALGVYIHTDTHKHIHRHTSNTLRKMQRIITTLIWLFNDAVSTGK